MSGQTLKKPKYLSACDRDERGRGEGAVKDVYYESMKRKLCAPQPTTHQLMDRMKKKMKCRKIEFFFFNLDSKKTLVLRRLSVSSKETGFHVF
jgi:hypothetical protein